MSQKNQHITQQFEKFEEFEETDEKKVFTYEIKNLINSAGKRHLSIREFAIEIWENVLLQNVYYLAFSSLLLEAATGLPIEVCCVKIDEMMIASLSDDLETTQAAITFMADGLVEYQKPIT